MLSSAQESVAYDVIVDLRQQLLAARTTVAIGGSWWVLFVTLGASSYDVSGNAKQAALDALDEDARQIDKLEGVLLQQVRDGLKSFQSWGDFAILVQKDIAFQAGDTGNWGLASYLSNVAKGTAQDAKDLANKAGEQLQAAGGGFGIGLGLGLLVVAVLVVKFR
jgi:hypothetical protein